jgi:hypothetical protein
MEARYFQLPDMERVLQVFVNVSQLVCIGNANNRRMHGRRHDVLFAC